MLSDSYRAVCYLWVWDQLVLSLTPSPLSFIAVQAPNPKNKMSYHRNHRNRNSENAAYIHVQKDAVKTVSWNAPPRGRPTNGSYNRADINKEPKFNLCSGEALYLEKFLTPVCGLQGPANLNCYRLPSSFSRPVTTLTP